MKIFRCDMCSKEKDYSVIEVRGLHAGHHFCCDKCFWEWAKMMSECYLTGRDPFDRNLDKLAEAKDMEAELNKGKEDK